LVEQKPNDPSEVREPIPSAEAHNGWSNAMSADTEQNKATTLAFYEKALNQRDADVALEYVGAHYKQHNPLR
jgi:hypothetical protein